VPQPRRTLEELINPQEPALPMIQDWAAASDRSVAILPVDQEAGDRALLALQVTTRSTLGAIVHGTGGVLIDGGWLRILGGGCPALRRSIPVWNRIDQPQDQHRLPGALLVADDAVGGFFAINGGRLDGPLRNVFYLAPDTCEWEDTGNGHTDWLHWVFTGDLTAYYESMRWKGWEAEVDGLAADECIQIYPFLWAAGGPIAERSRRPVPIEATWGMHAIEFPRQLNGAPA
jgi:hypothetical protein